MLSGNGLEGRRLLNTQTLANNLKRHCDFWFGVLLVCLTVLVYQPAWNGTALLDDEDHLIIDPESASVRGLISLWITPPPTHQYHPLVDTVFWIGNKLWDQSMLGY